MAVQFVGGDLFAAPNLDAVAHACNCAGVMEGGIASSFKNRWPAMYAEYKQMCAAGQFRLGDVFAWREDDLVIFNLATHTHRQGKATVASLGDALRRMLRLAGELGVDRIGLPRRGSGLGDLPWPEVRALIEEVGASTPIELVVFEDDISAARHCPVSR
jgi:O-acetyl-ADP-ribose deacetylase (regulator of RNase III)